MENSMAGVQEGLSLAEKTSSDPSAIEDVVQKMIEAIEMRARSIEGHNRTAKETFKITGEMRHPLKGLNDSAEKVRFATGLLKRLTGEFQTTVP